MHNYGEVGFSRLEPTLLLFYLLKQKVKGQGKAAKEQQMNKEKRQVPNTIGSL